MKSDMKLVELAEQVAVALQFLSFISALGVCLDARRFSKEENIPQAMGASGADMTQEAVGSCWAGLTSRFFRHVQKLFLYNSYKSLYPPIYVAD
jgi:hypothetical protein